MVAHRRLTHAQEIEACSLYADQYRTLREIAQLYGLTPAGLLKILIRNNIERRPKGGRRPPHPKFCRTGSPFAQMTHSLQDALDETLGFIERALDRIRAGDGAEAELHNVRAYLVNVLEFVARDPGIEAASDDLYSVAQRLVEGTDKGSRMSRLLDEAFLRFRDRLAIARPSERAVQMGLS